MSRTSFTKETTEKIQHVEQYLAATEVGKRLSEIGRWKRFRTEETDEEWLALLGPTAFVLPHQRHFVRFLQRWISTPEQLTSPVTVTGKTHSENSVTINTEVISLDPQGNFSTQLALPPGERTLVIQATDNRGRSSQKIIFVTVE